MIISLLLLGLQQVNTDISHQTKLKKKAHMKITISQQTALIRNAHYFDQHIHSSSVRTMSPTGPEFNMKCFTIGDKILDWAIQTLLLGSPNDQ